jgi:hypothetical protein
MPYPARKYRHSNINPLVASSAAKSCCVLRLAGCLLLAMTVSSTGADAQDTATVIRGGWIFDSVRDDVVRNSGIVIVRGKLMAVNSDPAAYNLIAVHNVQLADDEYVLPGLVDLHAHYSVILAGRTRRDEYIANPLLYLANGVTSTFPAGEYNPNEMMDVRKKIDRGELIGPRILNSGPYFGTARPGWPRNMTADSIYKEVDYWVEQGVKGFKAKGIQMQHLKPLIERAHWHGLTVSGHLESGLNGSVNGRDAILLGIDRLEHVMGGDMIDPTRQMYDSWRGVDTASKQFKDIVALYKRHNVVFNPTVGAPVPFTTPKAGFDDWANEKQFFTPYVQEQMAGRTPQASQSWDLLYEAFRRTAKAAYDGGVTLALATDNPSQGVYISGFFAHREMHQWVMAGIPPAAALKSATINGARALGLGDKFGSLEPGKFADLFVVRGNPLQDITNSRNVRLVMKGGVLYESQALLNGAKGKMGPRDDSDWREQ